MNALLKEEIQEEGDFVLDEKAKSVVLTQEGVAKAEKYFSVDNLSDPENLELQHYINNALKANYNMHLDKDYVIHEGEIVIVDEFTGRMMPGRRYSDGLHQAIEAKENTRSGDRAELKLSFSSEDPDMGTEEMLYGGENGESMLELVSDLRNDLTA